jgi:hypothetical protein
MIFQRSVVFSAATDAYALTMDRDAQLTDVVYAGTTAILSTDPSSKYADVSAAAATGELDSLIAYASGVYQFLRVDFKKDSKIFISSAGAGAVQLFFDDGVGA